MKTQATITTTWKVKTGDTSLILKHPGDIATTGVRWCKMGHQYMDVTEHRVCPAMPGMTWIGKTVRLYLGIGSDGLVHMGDPDSLAHHGVGVNDAK